MGAIPSPVQSSLGWVLGYNIQRTKEPFSSRSGHFELQEVVLLNMESCEERKEKKRTSQEQSLLLFHILRIAKLLGNSPQGSFLIKEA